LNVWVRISVFNVEKEIMKRQHGNSGKNDLANLYGRLKNLTSDEV